MTPLNKPPQPLRGFMIWLAILFSLVGYWAWHGALDVVTMAEGEVVPAGRVKPVQHLEGGIVSEILVEEGQTVQANQVLVRFATVADGADLSELENRLRSIQIDLLRLQSELQAKKHLVFEADLVAQAPLAIEQAKALFVARRNVLASQLGKQQEVITQKELAIEEIKAALSSVKVIQKYLEEQTKISKGLLKRDITNRYKHVDLLKALAEIRGKVTSNSIALKRSRAALREARKEYQRIQRGYVGEIRETMRTLQRESAELAERQRKYADRVNRAELISPVSGIVKSLSVNAIGAVVAPGGTVAVIVPAGERLVIEAQLPTHAIGYVEKGQMARLQLTSSDAMRFGFLDGSVTTISPDTLVSERGAPYYKVIVETEQPYFGQGDTVYKLHPGMQVMAHILTGNRTVLEYLLAPVLQNMDAALQEQ
ncbi:HlyD family type I secretion periplasmic adaptor subunit [Magnetococcus sp. PR-3]|uniref:HlyD family type I secretion periplasmic adaptor subunit n=1 Tax=Magnetococcus sp. PR-3 TaxID=3120355 RepID=UPI002FCDE925